MHGMATANNTDRSIIIANSINWLSIGEENVQTVRPVVWLHHIHKLRLPSYSDAFCHYKFGETDAFIFISIHYTQLVTFGFHCIHTLNYLYTVVIFSTEDQMFHRNTKTTNKCYSTKIAKSCYMTFLEEFLPQKIEGNQQHHAPFLFLLGPQRAC